MEKYLPVIVSLFALSGCTASQSNQRKETLEQKTVQYAPIPVPEQPKPPKQTGNYDNNLNNPNPSCDSWFSDPSPCCEKCNNEYNNSLAECKKVEKQVYQSSSVQYSADQTLCQKKKASTEESQQTCLNAAKVNYDISITTVLDSKNRSCSYHAEKMRESCEKSCEK